MELALVRANATLLSIAAIPSSPTVVVVLTLVDFTDVVAHSNASFILIC